MTETNTPRTSHWMPAITCSLAVGLVIAIGIALLRDKLVADISTSFAKQAGDITKLSARIDTLQSGLDTVSGQPKPNVEALGTQFAEVDGKLASLGERLTILEKKPEPAPVVPAAPAAAPVVDHPAPATAIAPAAPMDATALKLAVTSGKGFSTELAEWQKLHPQPEAQSVAQALAGMSQSGIPTEAEMNSRLRIALDTATQNKKITDDGVVGKINTHLSGLVSIKKAADTGPYTKLRANVLRDDTDTLISEVDTLSDEDRKPLEDWLNAAKARRNALAALAKLDNGGAH